MTTGLGALRGRVANGVASHRGIRYARAPVGELRLRPPKPVEPWTGVRDARAAAPSPLQLPDPLSQRLGIGPAGGTDEDCLALDVFAPTAGGAGKPVMAWLPGGAFASGAATAPLYDGSRLAREQDVVVVTVSYRVGALGFSHVGDDPLLVPNLGLYDQIAALRFVREHIAAFGGDPERVTVFGESAGAGSILALLGMPAARGCFDRAIVQSASPVGVLAAEEAAERTAALLRELDLGPQDVAALRELPAERILAAQAALAAAGPHRTGMLHAPVVDGVHLIAPPIEVASSGWALDVELLIGTTRDEMRLYYSGQPSSDDAACAILAAQMSLPPAERAAAARELLRVHREERARRGEATDACDVYLAVQTDLSLRVPCCEIAARRGARANTRMYRFDWPSPAEDGLRGACHTIDLPFVFGNLDAPGMREHAGAGPAAEKLARITMGAWAAFARSGDPTHDGLASWPVYDPADRPTLLLGARCEVAPAPQEPERALHAKLACFPSSPFA